MNWRQLYIITVTAKRSCVLWSLCSALECFEVFRVLSHFIMGSPYPIKDANAHKFVGRVGFKLSKCCNLSYGEGLE